MSDQPALADERTPDRALPGGLPLGRRAAAFFAVAAVWLAADLLTKAYFNGPFAEAGAPSAPFAGLVRFNLVHNTGMAWGMFGDSTFALGLVSLFVCAALAVYLFVLAPRASALETVGAALVFAGGLGNAVDRFALGYVVDFIEPVFIDFPVFNVADIGVTCGFVLFLLGLVLRERSEATLLRAAADEARERGEEVLR